MWSMQWLKHYHQFKDVVQQIYNHFSKARSASKYSILRPLISPLLPGLNNVQRALVEANRLSSGRWRFSRGGEEGEEGGEGRQQLGRGRHPGKGGKGGVTITTLATLEWVGEPKFHVVSKNEMSHGVQQGS